MMAGIGPQVFGWLTRAFGSTGWPELLQWHSSRYGEKALAVQPIVKRHTVRYPDHVQHPVQEAPYGCY